MCRERVVPRGKARQACWEGEKVGRRHVMGE